MSREQPKLGQLCDGSARRDAIHVAIAPVVAAVRPPRVDEG